MLVFEDILEDGGAVRTPMTGAIVDCVVCREEVNFWLGCTLDADDIGEVEVCEL
jgi:hypothetical protein